MASKRVCSIPDCGKTVVARNLCGLHYDRQRKHGDPLYTVSRGEWSKVDLAGQVFSRLTAIRPHKSLNGPLQWECRCECGNTSYVLTAKLRNGHTTSCGCYGKTNNRTHGMTKTPTHMAWVSMKSRCYDPQGPMYHRYGARGITVCDRWKDSFENFLADMRPRPGKGYSLDRIDNDGNYEPGNCRWASKLEQDNNRSTSRFVTVSGETDTVANMYRRLSPPIAYPSLLFRLDRGWSPDLAFSVPGRSREARAIDAGLRAGK